jgi:hypothetical protein
MATNIRRAVGTRYTATGSNISITRVAQQQDALRVLACSRLRWIARTVKNAPACALHAHRHIRLVYNLLFFSAKNPGSMSIATSVLRKIYCSFRRRVPSQCRSQSCMMQSRLEFPCFHAHGRLRLYDHCFSDLSSMHTSHISRRGVVRPFQPVPRRWLTRTRAAFRGRILYNNLRCPVT